MSKTFKIITLGCKLNFCESAAIEKSFLGRGFVKLEDESAENPADVYVINSCAVTGASVTKARHEAAVCRRKNPECVVALCGCFPQCYPEQAGTEFDADVITGNAEKQKIAEYTESFMQNRVKLVKFGSLSREFDEKCAVPDENRTRAFIKIEDGCDRFCTYCVIPTARGRVRSLRPEKIAEQASMCVKNGHKELVLTGINLGCYGEDIGLGLYDALRAAAESGAQRIRLGSLEPEMLSDELIAEFSKIKALCPHFHLSLQSGSDEVLKKMHRKYNTGQFLHVVEKFREIFPDCAITTDIITGFPEETDENFEQSVEFVKKINFAKIHVFPYSLRKGTVAAEMPQVLPKIKSERTKIMSELARLSEREFFRAQEGTTQTVLIERPQSAQYSQGFTEKYVPVRIFGEPLERHSLVKVKITGSRDGFCVGKVI